MTAVQNDLPTQFPKSKWQGGLWSHTIIDAITPYHNTNAMRPAIAQINLANLKHNFRLLESRAGGAAVMAVIKADAYGHGMDLVAPALFDANCRHFAVTDADEGIKARQLLPAAESIVLLSGIFDADDAEQSAKHRLTPVLAESHQIELLSQAGYQGGAWIKIDTGMQRLGANDPATLIAQCKHHGIEVAGIMSHLACADMPEHPLNKTQAEAFSKVRRRFTSDLNASLLNSAGVVSLPDYTFDFIRPGIALYGSEPVSDRPMGLKPVMTLTGQVMQTRTISRGTTVSYGASFTAPENMRIAIVSLGYGDGLPRHLSNIGSAIHQGNKLPIVGRVCMDFCLVDVTGHDIGIGDALEFWGEQQLADEVATLTGTIAYELFTGTDKRVCRRAV